MNKEERRQYIMNDLQSKMKWLEDNTKHDIIYLALQGSQNYEMDVYTDEYMSDIDVKAICVPSFNDVLRGSKMVSTTYIMDDNSHIDVKDIRLYIDMWKKSNPSFLEILFTEFYILKNDRFKEILAMADDIAFADMNRLLSCTKGMQMEKYKALKHPYPTIKDKIDKYGYDPKQLHHMDRLDLFGMAICFNNESFREALVIKNDLVKESCLELKIKPYPLERAEKLAKHYLEHLKWTVDNYRENHELQVNTDVHKKMEDIVYNIVRDKCSKELE